VAVIVDMVYSMKDNGNSIIERYQY